MPSCGPRMEVEGRKINKKGTRGADARGVDNKYDMVSIYMLCRLRYRVVPTLFLKPIFKPRYYQMRTWAQAG